nr:hypothetical protein [Nostoc sp. EkiNYC01]
MSNKALSRFQNRSQRQRSPHFESGMISEPLIMFGGRHEHIDPKVGLALYGPYSLVGQSRPSLTSIIVGIVGPPTMVADAEQWLRACQGMLTNDGSEPFLYPHFPGFNTELPFQCELIFGDTWRETIKQDKFQEAIDSTNNFYERIKRVVNLYTQAIEILSEREPRPQVILCCIPQAVIDYCTVRVKQGGEIKRVRLTKSERQSLKAAQLGQLSLFPEMNPMLGVEDIEGGHQNLRRGLKAEAMQYGIPTQIVWPRTLQIIDTSTASGERRLQDIATRAWNFSTALYHKAGGTPWRLVDIDPGVCYVGVSFYKEISETNPCIRTSMAQAFTAAGDGYVLRGNPFEWDASKSGRSPHLDQASAAALMQDVIDLYRKQNRNSLPRRIVVHKTSRYWEEELAGFQDACQCIPQTDFVTLGWRQIQFYRLGDYPPIRGTYVKFSADNLLLYTSGYSPFQRSYCGPRVPHPIEILEHHGDSSWDVILKEILGLTKMNWNTADFACSDPVTTAFSQRVGHILAELPPNLPMRYEYRFYM